MWEGEVDIRGYPKGRPEVNHDHFLLPQERWSKMCGEKLCVNPDHQRIVSHHKWWLEFTERIGDCQVLDPRYPLKVGLERTGGGFALGTCADRCINPAHRVVGAEGERPSWMLKADWHTFQCTKDLVKTYDGMVEWLRDQNSWVHPSYLGRTWDSRKLQGLDRKKVSSGRGRPSSYYRINDLEERFR